MNVQSSESEHPVTMQLWVDANEPVIHLHIESEVLSL
jgi:hypothetical protein